MVGIPTPYTTHCRLKNHINIWMKEEQTAVCFWKYHKNYILAGEAQIWDLFCLVIVYRFDPMGFITMFIPHHLGNMCVIFFSKHQTKPSKSEELGFLFRQIFLRTSAQPFTHFQVVWDTQGS